MISQQTISEVKFKAKVYDFAQQVVKLKKVGADYTGSCPFHTEKTPSFSVSPAKNIFKCFGCGAGGDAIEFIMKHRNLVYIDAVKVIAEWYNIPIEHEGQERAKEYVKPLFNDTGISDKALKYFLGRGISAETVKKFKITTVTEWMPKAKKEVQAICFNYFRDGELINVKYRAADKDFKLSKDAELIFYNQDIVSKCTDLIIVEGEIDCLTMAQCGYANVISVPNGAGVGNQRLDYLNNSWQIFENIQRIVLMLDNDTPGHNLRDELARRFGYEKCLRVTYPDGCKDANEILLKHGKEGIEKCLDTAKEYPIEGVFTALDLASDLSEFYLNGYPDGYKAGIPGFDDYLSFMLGQFTVITGIPGHGKSEFLDFILASLALSHDWSFAVLSFENQPSALHASKLMEKIVRKSFQKRYNENYHISQDEFNEAIMFLNEHFHFLNVDAIDCTIDGILDKAAELVRRYGIKGLLIDPWNYIEHKNKNGQTETQYISEVLTKIKVAAAKHNMHIFLVVHPHKMAKVGKKYEVPNLYSLNGSAHFNNKTDNGISVYRNFDDGKLVDIHILKVRFSWLGKVGSVHFSYNTETRQYEHLKQPF